MVHHITLSVVAEVQTGALSSVNGLVVNDCNPLTHHTHHTTHTHTSCALDPPNSIISLPTNSHLKCTVFPSPWGKAVKGHAVFLTSQGAVHLPFRLVRLPLTIETL